MTRNNIGRNNPSRRRTRPVAARTLAEEKKQSKHLDVLERLMSQPYILPKVPDVPKLLLRRDKVYTVQRSAGVGPFTAVNSTESFAALSFTLSALPASSEFTALFDQYMITQVSLRFTPRTGPVGGFLFRPNYLVTVIDYDDTNTVTLAQASQYQTFQQHPTDQPFERTLTPRVAIAAYNGVATTGYVNSGKQWVDVAYPDVAHYGLKIVLPPTTNNAVPETVLDCVATYTIAFRNPR